MSIPYVTDGETDLDSALFNPIIDAANNATSAIANLGAGTYNVLDYGAVGDGVTDDTEAIQDAIDAAGEAGGGTVYLPLPHYVSLRSTYSLSSKRYRLLVKYDNVRLVFGELGSIISDDTEANEHCTIAVWGQAKASPSMATATISQYDFNFNSNSLFTFHPFKASNPPTFGEYSVELNSAGLAANFAVGDVVYIRTGQTIDGGGSHGQPDAEINRVIGKSGAFLFLERPLLKDYVQEYYATSGLVGPTTTSSTAYLATWGIANVESAVIDGFSMVNPRFECHADDVGNCVSISQVLDPVIRNSVSTTTNMGLQGDGPHRGLVLTDFNHTQNQTAEEGSWMSLDKGCGDTVVSNGQVRNPSDDYLVIFHVNEGSANSSFTEVTVDNPLVPASPNAVFSQNGRGYRQALRGVRLRGGGNAPLVKFADVDGALLDGCGLQRYDGGESLSIGSASLATDNVVVGTNDYGHGTVSIHHNDPTKTPPRTDPVVLRSWVNYDDSTVVIGWIPYYALVTHRAIKRVTNFNGGSPTVSLGSVGSPTAGLGATDVKSADYDTAIIDYVNPGYEMIATVTPDGSTAGRVMVIVEYLHGMVAS